MELQQLLDKLKEPSWQSECQVIYEVYRELRKEDKNISVSKVGKVVGRSKSFVSISITLAECMEEYPEIAEQPNRFQAYLFILRKRKHARLVRT